MFAVSEVLSQILGSDRFAEMAERVAESFPKLAKPFTEDELAEALDRVITSARDAARVLKFRSRPG